MSARELQSLHCVEHPMSEEPRGAVAFPAVSPGALPQMRTAVERGVVAEPHPNERAEQQPCLLHVRDGNYVTARTVPHDGADEQLSRFTHALVTEEVAAYGAVRPAQLWEAPWWAERPAEDGVCEPFSAPPESGPLNAEALRDWVRRQQDGESWLLALSSALDELAGSNAARVVFVAWTAEPVLRWIASASLLLPQERALRVGFRVFSPDPRDDRYQVVAVTPDTADGTADPRQDNGVLVFNHVTGEHTRVTPTAAAGHWAHRFVEGDPFGVVDAVELAAQFARQRRQRFPTNADQRAAVILALGESISSEQAAELVDWLRTAPHVLAVETWSPVLDAVLAATGDRAVLHQLAETDFGERSGRLWLAMLRAELAAARDAAEGLGERVASPAALDWSERDAEQAVDLAERALNNTELERVDTVLRIATQFGLTPRLERSGHALASFVRWWADRPRIGFDPQRWSCGAQLVELLRYELARRLAGQSEQARATTVAVREHWWQLLLPVLRDPASDIDALTLRTAVTKGDSERREAVVRCRELLAKAEPDTDVSVVWNALFQDSAPTVDEMADLLSVVPSSAVTEPLAEQVFAVLDGASVSSSLLDVLRMVVHHAGPEHEQLRQLWQQDGRLRHWLGGLQRTGQIPGSGAAALQTIPETVLAARIDELATTVLDVPLTVAFEVVTGGGEAVAQELARELPAVWQDTGASHLRRDHAVALAFAMAWSDSAPDGVRRSIDSQLEKWAAAHQQADYQRVHRLLRGVDRDGAAAWQEWIRELSRKPRWARPNGARAWVRKLVSRDP